MGKSKRILLLFLIILLVIICCEDSSVVVVEKNVSVRGIHEENNQIEVKEAFDIISKLFSIDGDHSSLWLSERFLEGRVHHPDLSPYKPSFWNIPYLFRPFFEKTLSAIEKAKEEEESSSYASSSGGLVNTESLSVEYFKRKAITIETDDASSASYSLDGSNYDSYSQPITTDGPVDIAIRTTSNSSQRFFLSSRITCTFGRMGD